MSILPAPTALVIAPLLQDGVPLTNQFLDTGGNQRAAAQLRHSNSIPVDEQSGDDPRVFGGAVGMDGFQCAAAVTRGGGFPGAANPGLGAVDERDLKCPGCHQPAGNLGPLGKSFQHPDQFQFFQLEFPRAAVLPVGRSASVFVGEQGASWIGLVIPCPHHSSKAIAG